MVSKNHSIINKRAICSSLSLATPHNRGREVHESTGWGTINSKFQLRNLQRSEKVIMIRKYFIECINGLGLCKLNRDANHRLLTQGIYTHVRFSEIIPMYHVSFHFSHCLFLVPSRATWDQNEADDKPVILI